ncbi:tyrosine-type recombinase/integrase [Helicobacter felis]|uniref:tyrosine-type recombinase/integrase n=1 Tax=Helicobacter felis TaxID=214 RepID=UPI000CEE5D83|nr:site-specific integrase [Helicobacter felis]
MRFYNRNGKLYLETYEGQKRVRKSLRLQDTPDNRAMMFFKLGGHMESKPVKKREPKLGGGRAQEGLGRLKTSFVLEEYLKTTEGLRASSQRTINAHLKRMLSLLGQPVYIDEINKYAVHCYYNALTACKYSRNHNRVLIQTLRNFLDFAMTMDYIQTNPFFKRRIQGRAPVEKNPLNAQEVQQVINACEDDEVFSTYLMIAFGTGARVGEILALKRSDLDFEKSTISIERSINGRGEVSAPKTQSSKRVVEMSCTLKNALLDYVNKHNIKHYLFNNPAYARLNFAPKWHRLLKGCGIAPRRLYCTRHTFASLVLSAGGNLLRTSAMLGHRNAHITLRAYACYVPQPKDFNNAFSYLTDIRSAS